MKALKAKLQAATQIPAKGKAAEKLTPKAKASATVYGRSIVQTAIESHVKTRDMLLACKGKGVLELQAIREAVAEAWKEYAQSFTARKTHGDKVQVEKMQRASIYNRNSEMQAVLKAFEKYALMNKATRAQFDAKLRDVTAYHALIVFARHFNSGGKKASSTSDTPVAKRERDAWLKKGSERVQKIKETLRFAPLESLSIIEEWIEQRISKLQGAAKAQAKIRKAA